MPSKAVDELAKKLDAMQAKIIELQTDAAWLKRIIIGAASLGFLEKLVSWMVSK